jgi:hypothetical protein
MAGWRVPNRSVAALLETTGRIGALYQGTSSQGAEKFDCEEVLYQGSALAVPKRTERTRGFSPCCT